MDSLRQNVPVWICRAEKVFVFNFVAFSFVMFSCWFPTGFSATFSTLAFVFALPVFIYQFSDITKSTFEKVGLVLFGWLSLSVFWSNAPLINNLVDLSEYRFYFMLPVFIGAIAFNEKAQRLSAVAAIVGSLVALVTSYGLGLGWWTIKGADLSLSNRIFHGFIMSSAMLAGLLIWRENSSYKSFFGLAIAIFSAYNVLNIEQGRTGFLQVIFVFVVFLSLSVSRRQFFVSLAVSGLLICSAYSMLGSFHARVNATIVNVGKMISEGDVGSSAGQRLRCTEELSRSVVTIPCSGSGSAMSLALWKI